MYKDAFQDITFEAENVLIPSPLYTYNENEDGSNFGEENPLNLVSLLSKDKESERNIFNLNEKTTAFQTYNKSSFKQLNNNSEKEEKKFYSFEEIKEILQNSKTVDFNKIQSYLIKDSRIENAENTLQFIKKKRNRNEKQSETVKFDNPIIFGSGRKKANDQSERNHNKFSSDNISKKIKSKLFDNAITFVNNFLAPKNVKLKVLDYKYINNIKKDEEIKNLNEPLKELLSKNISSRFSNSPSDENKQIIDSILENEKNNEILMSIFNLSFRDWIEIFLAKKKVTDFENLRYSSYKEIEEKMPTINNLLNNILEKDGGEYLSSFIFYLYNYERYFACKRERRKKGNK